jgi:hypothetical protein
LACNYGRSSPTWRAATRHGCSLRPQSCSAW